MKTLVTVSMPMTNFDTFMTFLFVSAAATSGAEIQKPIHPYSGLWSFGLGIVLTL